MKLRQQDVLSQYKPAKETKDYSLETDNDLDESLEEDIKNLQEATEKAEG